MADLTGARWRKSSRSNGTNNCVEVADNLAGVVAVRDSKNPTGPALVLAPGGFAAFATTVRSGQLDR